VKLQTLKDLLEDQLKDLYSAENMLIKALPKMAKAATSATLSDAFTTHLEETRVHAERLAEIGQMLGLKITGKKCKAMEGLIEEGKEAINAEGEPAVVDSALIAAAQRVEHYEIAAYGTVRAFAETLGHEDVVDLLQETLDEEGATDHKLTEISVDELLPEAMSTASEEEEEEPTPPARKPTRRRPVGSRSR
jgi:ferritin-like metal-binding protein YciE